MYFCFFPLRLPGMHVPWLFRPRFQPCLLLLLLLPLPLCRCFTLFRKNSRGGGDDRGREKMKVGTPPPLGVTTKACTGQKPRTRLLFLLLLLRRGKRGRGEGERDCPIVIKVSRPERERGEEKLLFPPFSTAGTFFTGLLRIPVAAAAADADAFFGIIPAVHSACVSWVLSAGKLYTKRVRTTRVLMGGKLRYSLLQKQLSGHLPDCSSNPC